jgi:hypothetical protein
MSANNNLHRTSEESKAQEENEDEEETYDDDTSEDEEDHVDDDSEEIPELVPRDESISNSGDDTENETDEDTEDEIRVRALPSMMLLPLVQLVNIYEKKYKNENETRSVYTSPETVDVTRIINGWTIGRPLMDLYWRPPHHESPSIENQLSYGRNIDSDSDESDE